MSIKKRNLSGIYIFEKFEDEESREPTCIEDCTEKTQDRYLNSLEKEALVNYPPTLKRWDGLRVSTDVLPK